MPEAADLQKAELRQLDASFEQEIEQDSWCKVQFNPDSLKVSFANQLVQPAGAGDQRGTPARQFVGAGTTKLTLTLWFDIGSLPQDERVDDVRRLTSRVAFFITPRQERAARGQTKYVPPAVRFLWGTFQFDGLMDSLDETLEYWSPEGKPLRASMSLALSQQKIQFAFRDTGGPGGPPGAGRAGAQTPGTQPLAQAPAGANVPDIAAAQGQGDDWQRIAAANGIENPRLLSPGQMLDLAAVAGVPSVAAIHLGLPVGVQGEIR
jgi:hypothetical protein